MRKASRAPSGVVTREQFEFIMRRQQRGFGPEIVPQIFSRFDKDDDAKLTRQEASDPRSLVNEYFDKWDKDKDGQLTRQEITASLKEERAVPGALRPRRPND